MSGECPCRCNLEMTGNQLIEMSENGFDEMMLADGLNMHGGHVRM